MGAGRNRSPEKSTSDKVQSIFQNEDQRARLITGALGWIRENLRFFDPPQEKCVEDIIPENISPGPTRKAFGELGAALRLIARAPDLHNNDQFSIIRANWLRMADEKNIFFDIRRRVHLFPHATVALAVFRALGEPISDVQVVLQNVIDRGFMDRTERSAWQKLDLKYYFDAAGLRHSFPCDEELLRASSLLSPPALAYANSYDMYALTHLIFHFTDFGARGTELFSVEQAQDINDYVCRALASYLYDRNLDLVAELLICRRCLREPVTDLDRIAVTTLCEAQQPEGFIPDTSWLRGLPHESDPNVRARKVFEAVYHPTVVTLFLIACEHVPPSVLRECR